MVTKMMMTQKSIPRSFLDKRLIILNRFWKRWRDEYLRDSHRCSSGDCSASEQIAVGDIVVAHNDNKPRVFGKPGKVDDLLWDVMAKYRELS